MSAIFIGSGIYRGSSYGAKHPLSIPRVPTVIDLCRALAWLPPERYRTSPRAKPKALRAFHTEDYIAALQAAEAAQQVDDETRERFGLGTLSNPVFAEMYRRPATAAGGSLLAVQLLREGGIVYNPGGGTHHGLADRAAGFCYLNDPVLALLGLRDLGLTRILYVDIDAHHCDGVESAFAGAGDICLISLHERERWPFTGAFEDRAGGAALNLPVPKGFNDSEFEALLHGVILPFAERYQPQAIVLQAGADALTEDPLSRLNLSNRCHRLAVRRLKNIAPRFLVLGGGGYNPWSVGRCWSAIWAELAGEEIPDRLPRNAQDIMAALNWPRRMRPATSLLTSLLDAPRPGPVRPEVEALVAAAQSRIPARGV